MFQDLRAVLVAELGIEPGHDVSWLEHAILAQDPAFDSGPARIRRPPLGERRTRRRRAVAAEVPGPCARPQREGPLVGGTASTALLRDWWTSVRRRGRGACSWSMATRAWARRAWWPNWPARSKGGVASSSGAVATRIPWHRSKPFTEALGRYFQSLSADRISRMPDWQLSELSRLVLRLPRVRTAARGRRW